MAKFFKEYCDQTGETLPYTLRVLLGCSEETGMTDVDYYLERNPMPAFCFTPDADFPVGYGEKGGFGGAFVSRKLSGNLRDFAGGVAGNVVPDRASALVKADIAALQETENVKIDLPTGTCSVLPLRPPPKNCCASYEHKYTITNERMQDKTLKKYKKLSSAEKQPLKPETR